MKFYQIIIILIIITAIVISIIFYVNKSKDKFIEHKLEKNIYPELRQRSFTIKPEDLGIDFNNLNSSAYGLIMDFAFPDATITLVTFKTGDASLYLSTGGGIIGGVAHENVRNVVFKFINEGNKYLKMMSKVTEYPTATSGKVIFYVLTKNGTYKIEEEELKLQNKQSNIWSLYYLGQDVITEIRKSTGN